MKKNNGDFLPGKWEKDSFGQEVIKTFFSVSVVVSILATFPPRFGFLSLVKTPSRSPGFVFFFFPRYLANGSPTPAKFHEVVLRNSIGRKLHPVSLVDSRWIDFPLLASIRERNERMNLEGKYETWTGCPVDPVVMEGENIIPPSWEFITPRGRGEFSFPPLWQPTKMISSQK